MSIVYQHQLHSHKTRRPHPVRWTLIILALIAGVVVYGLSRLDAETTVSDAKPVTSTIENKKVTETFVKGSFSIDLPKGWQFTSKQQDIYTIYHFKSTLSGADGNRSLDVYEDSSLPNFAVNRMLPVTDNGEGGLTTDASLVSDNCTAYTSGQTTGRKQVGQLAKWQGVEFLCDMANPLRNVVGSGSTDGLNKVTLKTATSREHTYFFAYTDNNDKPDYNLFATALNSFKVTE